MSVVYITIACASIAPKSQTLWVYTPTILESCKQTVIDQIQQGACDSDLNNICDVFAKHSSVLEAVGIRKKTLISLDDLHTWAQNSNPKGQPLKALFASVLESHCKSQRNVDYHRALLSPWDVYSSGMKYIKIDGFNTQKLRNALQQIESVLTHLNIPEGEDDIVRLDTIGPEGPIFLKALLKTESEDARELVLSLDPYGKELIGMDTQELARFVLAQEKPDISLLETCLDMESKPNSSIFRRTELYENLLRLALKESCSADSLLKLWDGEIVDEKRGVQAAIQFDRSDVLRKMYIMKPDLMANTTFFCSGKTADCLSFSAYNGSAQCLEFLLSQNESSASMSSYRHETLAQALYLALAKKHFHLLPVLKKTGANLIGNAGGQYLLKKALNSHDTALARELIQFGVKPTLRQRLAHSSTLKSFAISRSV